MAVAEVFGESVGIASAEFGAGLKGLPDYCAPEVECRLASIDLEEMGTREAFGRRTCSFRNIPAKSATTHLFRFTVWYFGYWPIYPPSEMRSEDKRLRLSNIVSVPGMGIPRDCIAMIGQRDNQAVYATRTEPTLLLGLETICHRANYSRQIFSNVTDH